MAVVVLAVAGAGFLLACFCFERARRAQDRRVSREIMREADEINRKADAAARIAAEVVSERRRMHGRSKRGRRYPCERRRSESSAL